MPGSVCTRGKMMLPLYRLGRCRPSLYSLKANLFESASSRIIPISATGGAAQLFHTSPSYKFKENKTTTDLAILDNVKQVRHSPTPALALGFSGLIPFVAAPVYMITTGVFEPDIAQAQLFYGASILSFLGGVRWGLTLPEVSSQPPDWHNLGYSVTPSLIAWLGLLAPHSVGVLTVITGLGFTGYMDLAMWGYPNWFKGMRFCLTFVAVLSLWTSFIIKYILDEAQTDKESVKSVSQ
ncbi:transmembrane protein 69-like isoform X2 [Homarus americanus]|uniref:transmembrane protein 69-like isoform X2 n=1 Tax=Homarus americanus TaxID=6706 RepID=UPI001C437196|nr:transmembrane protein 69-like isoform X2 [Homarus americanus]